MEKKIIELITIFLYLTLVNFNKAPEKQDVFTQIYREGILSTHMIQQMVCEKYTLGWANFPRCAEISVR